MTVVNLTEADAIKILIDKAKDSGETAPRCIVMTRQQKERSLTRTVRFALVVTSNNSALIDALIQECLDRDNGLRFVGSEVNLQSDLEIDYLFFEASIYAKKI